MLGIPGLGVAYLQALCMHVRMCVLELAPATRRYIMMATVLYPVSAVYTLIIIGVCPIYIVSIVAIMVHRPAGNLSYKFIKSS